MAICEILFISILLAPQINHKDIVRTRWVGPGKPITFKEWQKIRPEVSPFRHKRVYETDSKDSLNNIQILVNAGLYDRIMPVLGQYISDLEDEGYVVLVDTVEGGSPEDIKNLLISIPDINGTLFIGDLPVPWFQLIEDYGEGAVYAEFPIDLYYMDIDGNWLDTLKFNGDPFDPQMIPGSDSIFDTHLGDLGPEIWFGRLTASPFDGEINLLNNYFEKAHNYRTGNLSLTKRALVYVDDDWAEWADLWSDDAGLLYSVRTTVSHPETTYAPDYRNRLIADYEWISVFVHSSPSLHGFKYNNGNNWSIFYASEIPGIDPLAFFYNLFACSNCRFVESGYMGGRYIFTEKYGLGAVGSAKTGSMLNFEDFYGPLGQGKTLGEAFKEWFDSQPLDSTWAKEWFYGMTLLGDPTLKPNMEIGIAERKHDMGRNILFRTIPNPFSTKTVIVARGFSLAKSEPERFALQIYDLSGRLVRSFPINPSTNQLINQIVWDGRNDSGNEVKSGIYFVKLKAGDFTSSRKVILMKQPLGF